MLYEYTLSTPQENYYNITAQVREAVAKSGVTNGICKRHGNCAECKKSHRNTTMYCELKDGSLQKRLMNFVFRKNRR